MRVIEIAGQVKKLGTADLASFRDWFINYDSEIWDRQIEHDAANGKLLSLAERALRDYAQSRTTEL